MYKKLYPQDLICSVISENKETYGKKRWKQNCFIFLLKTVVEIPFCLINTQEITLLKCSVVHVGVKLSLKLGDINENSRNYTEFYWCSQRGGKHVLVYQPTHTNMSRAWRIFVKYDTGDFFNRYGRFNCVSNRTKIPRILCEVMSIFYVVNSDICSAATMQKEAHCRFSLATILILYLVSRDIRKLHML
jgi:hypothetical protein